MSLPAFLPSWHFLPRSSLTDSTAHEASTGASTQIKPEKWMNLLSAREFPLAILPRLFYQTDAR